MAILPSCAASLVTGVPDIVLTEILPRTVNGKGLAEDAADQASGKDCRIIEGTVRKNRKICEARNAPETNKDFKGLSGIANDQAALARNSSMTTYPMPPHHL